MILLDTNAVIVAINSPRSNVRVRFDRALLDGSAIAVSSIVLFELWYGVANSARRERNAATLMDFLAGPISTLPFDLLIAAQARRRGALVVTADQREFARVPGLRSVDWAAA